MRDLVDPDFLTGLGRIDAEGVGDGEGEAVLVHRTVLRIIDCSR